MGNCLPCFGARIQREIPDHLIPGHRTVICVAGLATGALDVETKSCGQTDLHRLYCNSDLLKWQPRQTLDSLELRIVQESFLDSNLDVSIEDKEGIVVKPVEGIAGIRNLNGRRQKPNIFVWETLVSELQDKFNFHNFGHDWRRWGDLKYADSLVAKFKAKVEEAIDEDRHEDRKAAIIAHCLGCSVVLYCLGKLGNQWQHKYLDQVILLAPTFVGVPQMMPSFSHFPYVADAGWLPAQKFMDNPLGNVCATWPCMISSMPLKVGELKLWPDNHVFFSSPYTNYKFDDIRQFLYDLVECEKGREIGPVIWDGLQKVCEGLICPAVSTSIIYSAGVDTPVSYSCQSADLSAVPCVRTKSAGDGFVPASCVEKLAEAWKKENVGVSVFRVPEAVYHNAILTHRFTVAFIEKFIDHDPLEMVHITVIRASNLRNMDSVSLSDPYCRISIPGKKTCEAFTDVIDNDLNPEWNFHLTFYRWTPGDSIRFEIYDSDEDDEGLGDLLAKCSISSDMIVEGFEGRMDLVPSGTLTAKIWCRKYKRGDPNSWMSYLNLDGVFD